MSIAQMSNFLMQPVKSPCPSGSRDLRVRLGDNRVGIFISGDAAADEPEDFAARIPEFVFLSRRYRDGIAAANLPGFTLDANASQAGSNEVNLLCLRMVMFQSAA